MVTLSHPTQFDFNLLQFHFIFGHFGVTFKIVLLCSEAEHERGRFVTFLAIDKPFLNPGNGTIAVPFSKNPRTILKSGKPIQTPSSPPQAQEKEY